MDLSLGLIKVGRYVLDALMGSSLDSIDIRLIRVFCCVVRCGGMAAAELELNIGRSTIGRHVKELEARLGYTLCHRGRAGFSLTAEGEQVYPAGERALAALDRFQTDTLSLGAEPGGRISIGLFDKTVTNTDAHIHDAIAVLHDNVPGVDISIYVEPVNRIERQVIEGEYDVGIIPSHRTSASLSYQSLFNEQMYLYCAPGHALFNHAAVATDAQVLASHYAGIGFHSPNMELGAKLNWSRKATAYDQEAIATLIRSARFVGFLPEHYAQWFVDSGQLRRLGGDTFAYQCDFVAIHRPSPRPSRLARAFLEALLATHPG